MKKAFLLLFFLLSTCFIIGQTIDTIPVVVHVMHTGEPYGTEFNPSDEQIIAAIENLNSLFDGTLFGTEGTGDTYIRFALAKRNPLGECTTGITRDNLKLTYPIYETDGVKFHPAGNTHGIDELQLKNYIRWDSTKYCNIWLVNKIDGYDGKNTKYGTTYYGYSSEAESYPGSPWQAELDGVVLLSGFISNLDNNNTTITGLAHEIGHYLNLLHVFEATPLICIIPSLYNCNGTGDRVCDTDPVTKNENSPRSGANYCNCIIIPSQICSDYSPNTEQNIMSYTTYRTLYTENQKTRMHNSLALASRVQLISPSNLALLPPQADLSIVNHQTTTSYTNAGETISISFVEKNTGGMPTGSNLINFHLSADDILIPGPNGDTFLVSYPLTQTLQPFTATNVLTQQITIPSNTPAGIYYLFIAADGGNQVSECDELNNFASVIIQVSEPISQSQSGYRVWFDNAYANGISYNIPAGIDYNIQKLVPTNIISSGLHIMHFQFKESMSHSSIVSSLFYKSASSSNIGNGRYEYWIDNNYNQKFTKSNNNSSNIIALDSLPFTFLPEGLHIFNIRFRPSNTLWSSVNSSFFYRPPVASGEQAQYQYWFDNDYNDTLRINTIANTNFILLDSPFNSVSSGLHTFNIRFKINGGIWSSVSSSYFYKVGAIINTPAKYQYWFDNNWQDSVTINIANLSNFILLDTLVNYLPAGLHTLHVRFKIDGRDWSSIVSNYFYKDLTAGLPPNAIARCVYWYDNNWQNPKIVYYGGQTNLISSINADVSELSEGMHRVSMMFRDERGIWGSVMSDSFNRASIITPACPYNNRQYVSGTFLSNNAIRQWQVDTGSGFENISNNINYSGANSDTLYISNAPTNWYGYKYRCTLIDGIITATGPVYSLKFSLSWIGVIDNAWENPANWNCNIVPDSNVDVFINSGAPRYPEISTDANCRSITSKPGTSIIVASGKKLQISGY